MILHKQTDLLNRACFPGLLTAFLFFFFTGMLYAENEKSPAFRAKHTRGKAAIQRLGDRLPKVAARHGMTRTRLKKMLLQDKDLYLNHQDRLIYICGFGMGTDTIATAALLPAEAFIPAMAVPLPLDQTFLLHSRPGASKVIYLDFDGHLTTNSSWTYYNNNQAIDSQPLDTDGDSTTFSDAEKELIQKIWQRVAEDFAMFQVDVTTQDPGEDALIKTFKDQYYGVRAIISPTLVADFSGSGGVAFLNSFNANSDLPVFIFSQTLRNSEKYIGEAVSHEVGHSLGLSHDGKTDGTEYYEGHGDWAPIMGNGYYKSITQWSKGEYDGANNSEDDLQIMQSFGPVYTDDDHGNSIALATLLSGLTPSAAGIIEQSTDVDLFSFETGSGEISITISPAPRGTNLDISFDLLDDTGSLVMEVNQTNSEDETLTVQVAGGTYFIGVEGVGTGNPDTGYSDYASLGQYTLTASLQPVNTCSSRDLNLDGDVDGMDLLLFISSFEASDLASFAAEFGRTNCFE